RAAAKRHPASSRNPTLRRRPLRRPRLGHLDRHHLGRADWLPGFSTESHGDGEHEPGSEVPMRILVTGGAGYVGSASVEALLTAGHDVSVLDDLSTGHPDAVPNEARLEVWSYTDQAELVELLDAGRIEAILHCAARS